MEPTSETQQKHFLNRVTPFSKALALALFIALPLLTLYGGYRVGVGDTQIAQIVSETATTEKSLKTTRTYNNDEIGFSAEIPADWIVTMGKRGSEDVILITSPDYAEEEITVTEMQARKEMHVSKGARFEIPAIQDDEVAGRISNPDTYAEFMLSYLNRCSNCADAESIVIGSQTGVRVKIFVNDYDAQPGNRVVREEITTPRGSKIFTLYFHHAESSTQYERVIEDFISTFKFTK